MKRLITAIIPPIMMSFALLVSACAPSNYMVATLTQLPFAATPATKTPYPTFTPRPSGTPTPGPTVVDGAEANPTSAAASDRPTLDATVAAALTLAALPSATPTTEAAANCGTITYDTSIPEPNTRENYLKRHYDERNLPQGMRWVASGMLETDTYSWVHVQVQNQDIYWIERLVCQDASGQPYWEIADALILPELNAQKNEVAVNLCFSGEEQIPFAIAYGVYDPTKPAEQVVPNIEGSPLQVRGAWQMKDKFVPLSTNNLTCLLKGTQK